MIMIIFIFSLCIILVTISSIVIYKLWWKPIHIQNTLLSQGIKGPTYRFLHGNSKQIITMRKQAITTPYDLSHHDLFPRILPHFHTWIKLYGNNFLIWIGDQPQIVVTEPDLVKEILLNKGGVYKKIKPLDFAKRLFGGGLFAAEGQKWSKLRKIANFAFHGEILKDMVPAMVASVDTMLDKWKHRQGQEIEASKEFKLLTSEMIARTAFGSSYVEGKNIFEMLMKLVVLLSRNAFKIRFFGLKKIWRSKDELEADEVEQSLHDSILSLIKNREDMVKKGLKHDYGSDFLGSLMRINHVQDPDIRISVDDIIHECKLFYIAGHETTSNLLSWTVLLLSVYPEWQEKSREEVIQFIGLENPTAEVLPRLKILTMIINEVLRLYSPVVSIYRRVDCKTKLGKYEIPANVQVSIPPLALHRNPEIWGEDAHLFKPERFSDGVAKAAKGNSVGFLPFGGGPRACVGLNFAANEAKITLSMILQRYKLKLSPDYVHSPFQFLTVNPQHGIQIILQSV